MIMSSAMPLLSSGGRISASWSREWRHRAGRNIHENAVINVVIMRQILGSSALSLHQGCEWGAQCEKWGHLRALPLVHCPDAVPSGEAGGRCSESAEEPINPINRLDT